MKRRPFPLPAPRLLAIEPPIKGASALLNASLETIRKALAGHDLDAAAVALVTPDSTLASVSAAWSPRPSCEITSRDRVLKLANKLQLAPRDFAPGQVPVLIGVGKRAQLVTLDFSEAKPRRRGAA